jgi:hypothetical protein
LMIHLAPHANKGSFDSLDIRLRDRLTALRMTLL